MMIEWHRIFGLLLADFLRDSPFEVDLEKDVSLQQQLLDVIIIRREPGEFDRRLPDGLNELAAHNLITFKSHHQSLEAWSLDELLGLYVAYRKLVSGTKQLLPEVDFQLFAVSARYPENLARNKKLIEEHEGVYTVEWGSRQIQIVVASRLPHDGHNALLHLFSGAQDDVKYGMEHFELSSDEARGLLDRLYEHYDLEGLSMPYTMTDFQREYTRSHLDQLTSEERLRGLPVDELLRGLSREQLDELTARLRVNDNNEKSGEPGTSKSDNDDGS